MLTPHDEYYIAKSYIIYSPKLDAIKVGSSIDPPRRFGEIVRESKIYDAELVYFAPDGGLLENYAFKRYYGQHSFDVPSHHRHAGWTEWYQLHEEHIVHMIEYSNWYCSLFE